MKILQYEVVVVGAGLAGQMAAAQAARRGKSVVIRSRQRSLNRAEVW